MFSLLLCASLWQFDAPVPAGEPPKEFAITHQEASPALRDRVADQLGHAWQAKEPGKLDKSLFNAPKLSTISLG